MTYAERTGTVPYRYEQAPRVPHGHLLYVGSDRVVCHACGRDFRRVDVHAFQMHGMTAAEYRSEYGLEEDTPLCGDATRKRLSEATTTNLASDTRLRSIALANMAHGRSGPPTFNERQLERVRVGLAMGTIAARDAVRRKGRLGVQAAATLVVERWQAGGDLESALSELQRALEIRSTTYAAIRRGDQ